MRRMLGRSRVVALGVALTLTLAMQGRAQGVMLQFKPHANDTLRMRLDQHSEMTGVRRTGTGEASAVIISTMTMFSRAIVEGASDKGTSLLAVTDSVLLTTSDERSRSAAEFAAARMRGQRVRFRVLPDGTVGMNPSPDGAPPQVAQVVSLMPAPFPKGAISVGESWIREMPLPVDGQFGAQLSGKLQVTFRLDSLTHGGDWAFVSMRGEMHPLGGPNAGAAASVESGSVNGTMLVDKKRGWLTDSWFNIVMNSVITPPLATGVMSMRMQTRIVQHMHTLERR